MLEVEAARVCCSCGHGHPGGARQQQLPRDWSIKDGVMAPPGLLSGRDFRGITSPLAYAAIPRPWLSISAAVKWANREFNVAITPWVFCQLATVL